LGYDPHEDRHCFDANPDPDLDRHQHENSDRIRIGIKKMPIHNNAFFKRFLCPPTPLYEVEPSSTPRWMTYSMYLHCTAIERPVTNTKNDFTSLKDFHPLHVGADLNQISHGKL
jgi:hypothetical protein